MATLITDTNFHHAYYKLLSELLNNGSEVSAQTTLGARGRSTLELCSVMLHVGFSRFNLIGWPARQLSYRFAVAEWLWIAAGRNDLEMISAYMPALAGYSLNEQAMTGAYGPPLLEQRLTMSRLLREDPTTRQAVAIIARPRPQAFDPDVPCTLTFQLLQRGDHLHGIVNMRSSDAWLGLPYDFFTFSQLLASAAGTLGKAPGELTFNLASSHLYVDCVDEVRQLIGSRCIAPPPSPFLPGGPPKALYDLERTVRAGSTSENFLQSPWTEYAAALLKQWSTPGAVTDAYRLSRGRA